MWPADGLQTASIDLGSTSWRYGSPGEVAINRVPIKLFHMSSSANVAGNRYYP